MGIRKFFKNDFIKDFSTLFSGTLIASALPLLFSPIISRLYTPEQFGVFAIVSAVVSSISNVAGGRYEMAVMLPKKGSDSKALVRLAAFISLLISLLILLIIFLFKGDILKLLNAEILGNTIYIIPPLLWVMALFKPFNYWLNRNRLYSKNAIAKVVQGGGISIFTVLLGYWGLKDGLVFGYFSGWLAFIGLVLIFLSISGFFKEKISVDRIIRVARTYKQFPRLNVLSTFLNDTASHIIIFMITIFFTVEQTGYYNFSRQYLFVPLSLLSMTLSNVYFQRIAHKINTRESLKNEFSTIIKILLSIGIFVILIISTFGEDLFVFFFGESWKRSGELATILIFGFVFKFMISPFGQLLIALKRLKLALIFPVLYVILMLTLYFYRSVDFDLFIKMLVLFEVLAYSVYFVLTLYSLREYEKGILKR
ncbi:lipopolysaccharide biosynthesis protein [Salibacter halophilus]|uniref:Lipopolysaccharide biosynthesis protein n=1 Tax=Salibacter halophilus TaxID=1803916 RepID=A0A6N6M715_9FLAO|nr:lipopolysaccharide biosynthesis protein [Salibacter halophilus]KAB1065714.1 lipopolysaccharide biosynthesis protein [Salibacter halophilus]